MTTIPTLSEQTIRSLVGVQTFQRGQQYYNNDAIFDPRRQGMLIKARCQGSSDNAYHVQVLFDATGVESNSCTCPLSGYCKHVTALLLTWLYQPEDFLEQEEVEKLLEHYEKPQLIALIQQMLRREPDLEVLLPKASTSGQPINLEIYRRQVNTAIRRAGSGWGAAGRLADELAVTIEAADGLVAQQDYANAIAVYEVVVDGVLDQSLMYDDEDGYLHGVIQDCTEGLEQCFLPVQDDAKLHEKILHILFTIYRFDIEAGGISVGDDAYDLLLANVTDEERKTVASWVRETVSASTSDWSNEAYGGFLLDLEADTLDDEAFLQVARETGRTHDVVDRLLALERVDEATKETEHVIDYTMISLADLFVQHGHADVAERLMEERSKKTTDMRVLEWLKKRYETKGNREAALRLANTLFRSQYATLSAYQEIRTLATDLKQWEEIGAQLIDFLHKKQNISLLISIALDEGEIDKAVELVKANGKQTLGSLYSYGSYYHLNTIALDVAKAAEETRPQAAIQLYQEYLERLIAIRGRENYKSASELLKKVRALYMRIGESEQWDNYITLLREKNRSLRALKEELTLAGL